MNCRKARKLLVDYSEGFLAEGKRQAMERHLSRCEACRHELSQMEKVRESVRSLGMQEPDADFWQRFHRKLSEKLADVEHVPASSRLAWQPRLALASVAATMLLIAGLAIIGLFVVPESPEHDIIISDVALESDQMDTIEPEELDFGFLITNGYDGIELALADLSDEEIEEIEEDMILLIEEALQGASEDMVLEDIYEETVYEYLEDLSLEELEELYKGLELT